MGCDSSGPDLGWRDDDALRSVTPTSGAQAVERQKKGVLGEHPSKVFRRNYRFFAAFFFAPLAAFFAIVLSLGCAAPASDDRMAVTTGGLSHPPSYQM